MLPKQQFPTRNEQTIAVCQYSTSASLYTCTTAMKALKSSPSEYPGTRDWKAQYCPTEVGIPQTMGIMLNHLAYS